MTKSEFIKGWLIRPIVAILKSKYKIMSPLPKDIYVKFSNNTYSVYYNKKNILIDFSNDAKIKELIKEIKTYNVYQKL